MKGHFSILHFTFSYEPEGIFADEIYCGFDKASQMSQLIDSKSVIMHFKVKIFSYS